MEYTIDNKLWTHIYKKKKKREKKEKKIKKNRLIPIFNQFYDLKLNVS